MSHYILTIILVALVYYFGKLLYLNSPSDRTAPKDKPLPAAYVVNLEDSAKRMKDDVQMLAGTIGIRSIFQPDKLKQAKDYVQSRLEEFGDVKEYPYIYKETEVANLELDIFTPVKKAANRAGIKVKEIGGADLKPSSVIASLMGFSGSSDDGIILIGAHYDTVSTTPGADDNASAIAVLLELARQAKRLKEEQQLKKNLRFLAFTLEEPPAFSTPKMGSRQYVKNLKQRGEKIKGMICLEMVGYKNIAPDSQQIPFPLNFRNYPRTGDFIAFLTNMASVSFLKQLISLTDYENTLPYEKLVVPGKGRMLPISRLSDHIAFWDNGYPAVMVTDTSFLRNPNYHDYGDRPETLDYHFMAQLVQTLILLF